MGQQHSKNGFATSKDLPDLTAYTTLLDYIKGGGQADVRKARVQIKNESKIVAVKQLRRTDEAVKLAHFEMKMWQKANGHVNVVQLLGKILDPRNFPSMVSEFCEQGDLLSYTFSVARFNYKDLLCDVLQGLAHIHQLNLAHGDLKPENIVLTAQSKRLTAKICDFGSARDVSLEGRISIEYTSTALYRSPELATEEEEIPSPSFAADVWAFGCVAFVVLCKKLPYHWVKNRWTIDIFIASKKLPHSEDDQWPEASLRQIVQGCWCDTTIRPSAAQLFLRISSASPSYPVSQVSSPIRVPSPYIPGPEIIHQPSAPPVILPGRPTIIPVLASPQEGPQIIRIGLESPRSDASPQHVYNSPSSSSSSSATSQPRIIQIGVPAHRRSERSPPHFPTRIIRVGDTASRSRRSRSRSQERIIRDRRSAYHERRGRSRSRSPSVDSRMSPRPHAASLSPSRSRSRSPSRSASPATRVEESRSYRSRSHSPTRVVEVGAPSRSRRSRSRSHSPTPIIHVGGSESRQHRSRPRSLSRITETGTAPSRSRRSRSYSRSPERIIEIVPERAYPRSRRSPAAGGYERRPAPRSTGRPIIIDINITIDSDDSEHEPRRIRQTVRVPMPSRRRVRRASPGPIFHTPTTRTSPIHRPTIIIPQHSDTSSQSRQPALPRLGHHSAVQSATRSPETRHAQSVDSSSAASELEQRFAHQASYTRLRRTLHNGKIVIKKSLRQTSAKYTKTTGATYLNYTQDMFNLKHKHLVDIHGVSAEPSANGILIMESYFTNLLSYRESLDYKNQLRVCCEVLEGLQALHTSVPPIAHQCLKASNIMVDEHGSVKLSLMNSEPYLAFAVEPSPTRSYSPNWPVVSRWWSPEVFEDKAKLSTIENDIWAFGCVVLEVLTGSSPYPKFREDASLVNHVRAGHSPDLGLRRAPKLRMWQDVRRCWSTPRPTTGYMLNLFCDYLAREVMRDLPDLTAQVAKAANPFVRGRTADIYSGIYTNRRERSEQISVVVKHVRPNNTAQQTHFIQWLGGCAQNRRYFDHENICSLLGVMYSARLGPLLVLEHHAGGTLSDYMRTNGTGLSISNKLRIMSDILAALVHLHERHSTAWGDLHPTNIVLDHTGSPKLCGLGPRTSLHHEAASQNDLTALRYFAPERFQPEDTMSHTATDIWTFGCLALMVLSGHEPYREMKTVFGVARAITGGRWPYELGDCEYHSVWSVASPCWEEGLLQRPRAGRLATQLDIIRSQMQ